MALILHPPYSTDFAPCDFFIFQKTKLKLKVRRLEGNEEIQAESQKVLVTLTDKVFPGSLPKMEEIVGPTGVYMREGTTSRAMGVDNPYGEFYDFYSVSPEYFVKTLANAGRRS
jgi:hypothetical protein